MKFNIPIITHELEVQNSTLKITKIHNSHKNTYDPKVKR